MSIKVNPNKWQFYFRWIGMTTIVAVYLLILVGGIVRSTGSGMGCPDWPKCFGRWIPPTEYTQLPDNYKEKYVAERLRKNERIAKMLSAIGWTELANRILHDKSIREETDFNVVKTWIEYINRLIGVLIGLLIFTTCVLSFSYLRSNPLIVLASFVAFVLVGFEGWLGSIVVSTNLLPGLITAHMMLAVLIVFLLTYAVTKSQKPEYQLEKYTNLGFINTLLILGIVLSFLQVMWGTEVREAVDITAKKLGEAQRSNWLLEIGSDFYWHRSFSWAVLLVNIALIYCLNVFNIGKKGLIYYSSWGILGIIIIEIGIGAGMAYFAIPPTLQPLHLLLGTMLAGIQFFVWLRLMLNKVPNNISLVNQN
jgi:heme a synthase